MGSTFFGLNIAKSGLFVSQRALQVVSHNIANANTPGFSRQRLDMKQYWPDVLPGVQGTLGRGVDSQAVIQIRDQFYDKKVRVETSKKGEWEIRKEGLEEVESIFNEPTETGIRTIVDNFFSSVQELSKNADNLTSRALVRQRAIAYTESTGEMYSKLRTLQSQVDFEIKTTVDQINGYAEQIRDLNKSIFLTELDEAKSNDLRDQRNLLLDKLSELTDINYFEDNQRHFYVLVGGKPLVSHYEFDTMKVVEREEKLNEDDVDKLVDVEWTSGGKLTIQSGKLRGLIDFRDDRSGDKKGIPYYMDTLNKYTDRMTSELSRIHMGGFDFNGNKGVMFFTKEGMSSAEYEEHLKKEGLNGGKPMDMTKFVLEGTSNDLSKEENDKIIAQNIRDLIDKNPDNYNKSIKYLSDGRYYMVDRIRTNELTISKDIDLDLNKLAAAQTLGGIPRDGSNALNMINMRYNENLFAWGSSDDYVKSLVSNMGVDTQAAKRMVLNEDKLIVEIENKRQSIMGVSFDEEVSDMIRFQHAYNANARMLTTMDELLETVINRLGLVGR